LLRSVEDASPEDDLMIDRVMYITHKNTRKADEAYADLLSPPSSPPQT
jgi:hypothetical protein